MVAARLLLLRYKTVFWKGLRPMRRGPDQLPELRKPIGRAKLDKCAHKMSGDVYLQRMQRRVGYAYLRGLHLLVQQMHYSFEVCVRPTVAWPSSVCSDQLYVPHEQMRDDAGGG